MHFACSVFFTLFLFMFDLYLTWMAMQREGGAVVICLNCYRWIPASREFESHQGPALSLSMIFTLIAQYWLVPGN